MSKPWIKNRSRNFQETRIIRKVLVLCEDSKTAPNYFKKFEINADDIAIDVFGTGMNTESLVQEAIQRQKRAAASRQPYNRIWCVFDRDSFPAQNFNNAFSLAKANAIDVAYANQCFELWYWLHFDFQQTSVSRAEYGQRLSDRLGRTYNKNDESLFAELKERQIHALRNAKKLISIYGLCNPEQDDPSTNIHLLVEFLNQFTSSY